MRTYTVKDFCERYLVGQHTALQLIRDGHLKAIDVSRRPGGRPRWRITESALAEFELLRASQPPAPKRRRKRQSGSDTIQYY